MSNIYSYQSYRKWIKDQAQEWKKRSPSHTLARRAEMAEVQAPYLTNVLKERAHLNADQFFSVAQVFALGAEEFQYGQTLLELERSSHEKRKEALRQKLAEMKKQKLKTESHLKASTTDIGEREAARFYLEPELQLVHAFFGVEEFANDHDLIARSLRINPAKLHALVQELESLGFLKKSNKGYQKTKKSIHLSKSSPLCRPQQLLMQHRSLQHQQGLAEDSRYNFAVTFTADPETREKIQQEFLRFLSTIEETVRAAPSEDVYQMNFDLFAWSR